MSTLKKSWTGTLKLGFVTQPVAAYATSDSKAKTVAFNQLHVACGCRINSQTVCRTCDDKTPLTPVDIVRGYEHTKGSWVRLTDDEIKSCQVETTKVIDLKEFVPLAQVTPLMIAESVFVAPVEAKMAEAYVLIREALNGMAGIGTICIGNKEKLVAVVANGRGLVMHTLRHASEVRDVLNVPLLEQLPETADTKTVKMMRALMTSMESKTLDLEKYPNRYVENVMALVKSKVDGTEPEAPVTEKKPVIDLAAMLLASLEAAGATKEL